MREEHADGEIWSSSLREISLALGKQITDKVVLQSHFMVRNNPQFCDGVKALKDADRALFGGAHRTTNREHNGTERDRRRSKHRTQYAHQERDISHSTFPAWKSSITDLAPLDQQLPELTSLAAQLTSAPYELLL